jgi:hypothetical protein
MVDHAVMDTDRDLPRTDVDACVRCGRRGGLPGLDLCTPCAVTVRIELSGGIVRLERYLARWAAFDQWLSERGLGRAVA